MSIIWLVCACILGLVQVEQPREESIHLLEVFERGSDAERVDAYRRLMSLGEECVPEVINAFDKSEGRLEVRRRLARLLGDLGPATRASLPKLLRRMNDPDDEVMLRLAFAASLSGGDGFSQSEESDQILPRVEALLDGDFELASGASRILSRLGPKAARSVPRLIRLAIRVDKADEPQMAAGLGVCAAIAGFKEAGVRELLKALGDDDAEVREYARVLLQNPGVLSARDVPMLVAALKSRDSRVLISVVETLGKVGPAAAESVPELTRLAKRQDEVGEAAMSAKRRILH